MNKPKKTKPLNRVFGSDKKFLLEHTKLPELSLDKLIEEDLDLVIDALTDKDATPYHINMTFEFRTKHEILKAAKNTGFDFDEKLYVVKCITDIYPPTLFNAYALDQNELTERNARFWLILLGFFEEKIKPHNKRDSFINYTIRSFRKEGKGKLADHVPDWIKLLKSLDRTTWKF